MRHVELFMAVGFVLTVVASSGAADQNVKATVEGGTLTSAEVVTQASAGSTAVLGQIASARSAITRADYPKATGDVTSAQSQLQKLRQLNPSAALQDRIHSVQSKLDTDGADAAYADLVPIAEGLVAVDDYDEATAKVKVSMGKPVYVGPSRVKRALSKARERLEKKDVESARVELQAAYEAAVYTEVDLPVASSYYEVTNALEALQDGAREGYDKGYAKVADEQLAAAQASAQTVVSVAQGAGAREDVATEPK